MRYRSSQNEAHKYIRELHENGYYDKCKEILLKLKGDGLAENEISRMLNIPMCAINMILEDN